MNTEFRTRLRVKTWKYADILKKLMEGQKINHPAPWSTLPQEISTKCARCGMHFGAGPMGYCCPHGNMCGIPVTSAPNGRPPIVYLNPRSWETTSAISKADIWN